MRFSLRTTGLLALLTVGLHTASHAQRSVRALSFSNMRQQKVTVPLAAPAGAFTLEARAYYLGSSFQDGGTHNTVLEFGNDALWFGVTYGGQLSVYQVAEGGNVPTNAWAHLAYTWDGTTSRLYLNGVQVAVAAVAPPATGQGLGIGYNAGDTGWNGYLDDVMIWGVARSAAQIQDDAQNGAAPNAPGLLAYFKFDEGTGQVVTNQVSTGPNGVLGSTINVDVNDPAWANFVINSGRSRAAGTAAQLQPNFPNPFAGTTTIPFVLTRAAHVRLRVQDLAGRPVATLLDGLRPAGNYTVPFAAAKLAAGTYVCQLEVDGQHHTRRLVVQ